MCGIYYEVQYNGEQLKISAPKTYDELIDYSDTYKDDLVSVIENNERSYKKPIITLDVYNTNETTIQDLNGEVFLKLNYDFTSKQTINFDKISHSEIKKNFFYDVNAILW